MRDPYKDQQRPTLGKGICPMSDFDEDKQDDRTFLVLVSLGVCYMVALHVLAVFGIYEMF